MHSQISQGKSKIFGSKFLIHHGPHGHGNLQGPPRKKEGPKKALLRETNG